MGRPLHLWAAAVCAAVILFGTIAGAAAEPPSLAATKKAIERCQGEFKERTPTPAELKRVLADNEIWVKARIASELDKSDTAGMPPESRRANLCRANLADLDLSGAGLTYADLSGAVLTRTNLTGARLQAADLTGAELVNVDLTGAQFQEANFTGAHLEKANLTGARLEKANLTGAVLADLNLTRAHLEKANLSEATLERADLTGANLWSANLRGLILHDVDLSKTSMRDVDLTGAYLEKVNLTGANLEKANLTRTILLGINLSGARLQAADLTGAAIRAGTDLTGAILREANLNGTFFEPKGLPDVDAVAYGVNLELMRFRASPNALNKLRKAFKEAGLYEQERKITYAIKHCETMDLLRVLSAGLATAPEQKEGRRPGRLSLLFFHVRHWGALGHWGHLSAFFEGLFTYVFFDCTTAWGMAPRRALLILLALIPVFAVPYVIALRSRGANGIWRRWPGDRMRMDLGSTEPVRLHAGWRKALVTGLYFSVLSAFNIGWRELNVGNWIQRLQAREYTLGATGWVRTVAGAQALISVGLLALWVVTYFGRPFE